MSITFSTIPTEDGCTRRLPAIIGKRSIVRAAKGLPLLIKDYLPSDCRRTPK